MASSWKRSWGLIVHSLKVFQKYPSLILPIMMVWLIYAPTILYLKYFYPWRNHDFLENAGTVFLEILAFSFIILLSCDMLLELIDQIEHGEPSLGRAVARTIGRDIVKILPLAMLWAAIWFILTLVDALLSSGDEDKEEFNAENVAATLGNYQDFSLSRSIIDALEKGVRMVMFLILPAIAWENLSLLNATKKGLTVLKAHLGDFARGYALTYAAAGIVFLPPAIIFELGSRHGHFQLIHFPDSVWVGVIIYVGFAWSFCIYLEQMFMAQLYGWHLKWEKRVEEARQRQKALPTFGEVVGLDLLTDKGPLSLF